MQVDFHRNLSSLTVEFPPISAGKRERRLLTDNNCIILVVYYFLPCNLQCLLQAEDHAKAYMHQNLTFLLIYTK